MSTRVGPSTSGRGGKWTRGAKFIAAFWLLITLLSSVLGLWAFWFEPASLRVVSTSLQVSRWPATCRDLRVVVLTDLHVGSPYIGIDKLKAIVARANAQKPDLVLLPGDFVIQGVAGGHFVPPESAAIVLAALHAPMGVYAVLGNHDHWLSAARVQAALESNGIPVLEDRSVRIRRGACALSLVGVSDFNEGQHDVQRALQGVPAGAAVLAFTHNPDVFPSIPSRVPLTIAGHTHGGQVYLPGIGRPIVPSEFGQRYAIGHVREGGRDLFVSSGVGTSILPVRFLVPPEITVLEISN